MALDKSLLNGNTTMLILKLLEKDDMYGYQMIDELTTLSKETFELKAGTLYPLLHNLEKQGMLESYDKTVDNSKVRKYYSITKKGKGMLFDKQTEWIVYSKAVNRVLKGGVIHATT